MLRLDMPSTAIPNKIKDFLESGISVVVGTRDMRLAPEIVRAWGPRVSKDRKSVSLCVPMATGGKTLDNLESNGRISASFTLPTNLQSVQLKGTWIETTEPDAADLAAVAQHREAFALLNEKIGIPRRAVDTLWRRELETSSVFMKLRFATEQIFDQTPGPDAGSRL
jgi:hypothetical protein